jgi:Acyl-CoA reductase (LuxC)
MNLVNGKILNSEDAKLTLFSLEESIADTLSNTFIEMDKMIKACDALSSILNENTHLPLLLGLGIPEEKARRQLGEAKAMLKAEYLRERVKRELGDSPFIEVHYKPYSGKTVVRERFAPLGVLMHIAAGNMEALPAFSVIEGLLTGNINILKLPGGDDGISILILSELIRLYPIISGYIYVYDFPSGDLESMQQMAKVADAIVIWGGDEAVSAARKLVSANTRLIEWGHKVSFAYVTREGAKDEALESLAEHICDTEQLLCNSCQGIYYEVENIEQLKSFAERFYTILNRASQRMSNRGISEFVQAKIMLQNYTEELLAINSDKIFFSSEYCSVEVVPDSELTVSTMFRNCWIKPLLKGQIVSTLKPHKNHLQSAALICAPHERKDLEELLICSGIIRITGPDMSEGYCGEPHDGEYSLRRYVRRIAIF